MSSISIAFYLPYGLHYISHINCTISIISTVLYLPYLLHLYLAYLQYYIYHTQAGPAHIHAVCRSLPPPCFSSLAAAFLCEITCWRIKIQHQRKIMWVVEGLQVNFCLCINVYFHRFYTQYTQHDLWCSVKESGKGRLWKATERSLKGLKRSFGVHILLIFYHHGFLYFLIIMEQLVMFITDTHIWEGSCRKEISM